MRTVYGSISPLRQLSLIVLAAFLTVFLALSQANAKQPYSGIVMDAKTGKVLYGHRESARAYPASLTKMMTLYMMFDAMERGELNKNTRIRFSRHAASMQPSKLGVKAGSSITAEQAIYALVTKSANDAAAAVGEHLGGSEWEFARMMTAKAREIGMKDTTFRNASGLPDSKQVTTARDMAILGIALREHFPREYRYFATRSFKFGSRRYGNHNRLLGQIRGVDGIKTGYTRASGFNLVSSAEYKGRSIVAVVMGGRTGKSRNAQMAKLINTYLPKASRGPDRMIVAKGGQQPNLFARLFGKKNPAPVPSRRPLIETNAPAITANAYVAETPSRAIPSPVQPVTTDPMQTASVAPETTTSAPSGWQIQIGAMPSRNSALERLATARERAPSVLANVANYTEEVESGGTILHRARFAGFNSKSDAWDACAALKKKKFDCLALAN